MDHLDFFVSYDDDVTVGGMPRLVLTVGTSTLYAEYASSQSSPRRLAFRYVIQSGQDDNDGIAIGADLDLNGGSIKDSNGNRAALALTLPLLGGIKINGSVPSLNSVAGPSGFYKSGQSVTLTATFGQSVEVSGTPALVLDIGGASGHAVYSGNGNASLTHTFAYTVGASEDDSNGIQVGSVDFNYNNVTSSIVNNSRIGVPAALGQALLVTGVRVDNTAPLVAGLDNDGDGTASKSWSWSCTDASLPCDLPSSGEHNVHPRIQC